MNGVAADVLDDRPAGLPRRALAVLVDLLLLLALGGGPVVVAVLRAAGERLTGAAAGPRVPVALLLAGCVMATAVGLVQWHTHGRLGWTVGRRLLGVRTVDADTRRPLGPGRVLLRALVVAVAVLAWGVGPFVVLLSPLLDRTGRRRGWHDQVVGSQVLRVVPHAAATVGPVPYRVPRPAAAPGRRPPAGVGGPPDAMYAPPAAPGVGERPSVLPAPSGGLVLAPVNPQRGAPDLDTRAIPVVRATPTLAFGLAPELEMTRPAPPRTDVVPATPAAAEPEGLRVAIDDGRVLTVSRLAMIGRNPTPDAGVQVVRVVDPDRSVSKVHLQLAVDDAGGAWVVDRGSTNGTLVTLPDGAQVVCPVDHPVRLREGAVVDFGDRSLRVVSMPPATGR